MPEIKYLARMSEAPRVKNPIYQLSAPAVTQRSVKATAERLGLSPRVGMLQQDAETYTYSQGSFIVTLYRASGGLKYRDVSRFHIDDGKGPVEYDDTEAVGLAETHLRKLELVPVDEYKLLRVTHLYVGGVDLQSGEVDTERAIDASVIFRRIIDDVPVDGPGGMVQIYLDARGELSGIDRIWRNVASVYRPAQAPRQPKVAEEGLRKYLSGIETDGLRVEVQDMRYGYFEMNWNHAQRFLQPAYIMPIKIVSTDDQVVYKTAYVHPAAQQPVGRIMPIWKQIPEQPKRED